MRETSSPETISVVVPTHGRADLLPRLAAALAEQEDAGAYEVIVVDDRSPDATQEVLARLRSQAGFPLRFMRTASNHGPAAARNLGWREARGSLVAFTDDDCVPDRRWLAELRGALARAEVVQGLTEVDPEGRGNPGPFARKMAITRFSWKFETCNMGYRRPLLESLGGFDERFPEPYGEDFDLGWRAMKAGAEVEWAPAAIVFHRVHTTGSRVRDWIAWLGDTPRRRFAALMVKRHPEMREHLSLRWFYKPEHPRALAACLGLGLVVRGRFRPLPSLAGLAVALPWVWFRTRTVPFPSRRRWLWVVLPMGLVADLAEVAIVAQGSVRYRTVLL